MANHIPLLSDLSWYCARSKHISGWGWGVIFPLVSWYSVDPSCLQKACLGHSFDQIFPPSPAKQQKTGWHLENKGTWNQTDKLWLCNWGQFLFNIWAPISVSLLNLGVPLWELTYNTMVLGRKHLNSSPFALPVNLALPFSCLSSQQIPHNLIYVRNRSIWINNI